MTRRAPDVVVLDYGSGNVRSVVRALERVGARVVLTADTDRALSADGLLVPGVGNFSACMAGLKAVRGPQLVERRLAGARPVLGICVGMQVLFERSTEPASGQALDGLGQWPGTVERLAAPVVPHTGWNTVKAAAGTRLLAGVEDERFYFVHSYGVLDWRPLGGGAFATPLVHWAEYGTPFVAAVENGALSATQFHPEKSGDVGAVLLSNWVHGL